MKRGYRIGYVPVLARPRQGISTVRIIGDGLGTLKLLLRLLTLFDAFRFFTLLSLAQILTALIYGLITALDQRRGLSVLASTVLVSGVLTFFMGMICDQITELRKERFEDFRRPED